MGTGVTSVDDRSAWGENVAEVHLSPAANILSPFLENSLQPTGEPSPEVAGSYTAQLASPFSEAAGLQSQVEFEAEAVRDLFAELEDEEFTDSVERLVQEGAARYALSLSQMAGEIDPAAVAEAEVEQWLESLAEDVDQRLVELAEQYGERTVESLSEAEIGPLGTDNLAGTPDSPLDAQEDFFKKLWRKVKKVARGVVKLAKKGVSALSRFFPIGKLVGAVRRLIRPLLRRVLGKAVGRLPAPLQPAARKLARRFGLEAETEDGESEWSALAEPHSTGEDLASEFDRTLTGYLLAPDATAAEGEAVAYDQPGEVGDPVAALDDARRRLAEYFMQAEHQADPTAQMEQFIPAVLPLVKLGVKIVGRKRVVGLVAKLIAQLIQPMVGAQLAPILSRHLASSGLALIGLEAEADDARLGTEALVSVVEDTIREVFAADSEALEDELFTSGLVQESFVDAATRHLPEEVLRPELMGESEDERGVWVMMPRRSRGTYRYRAFSRRVPLLLHRPMARAIIVGEDETLEDRLHEAGVDTFPVEAEVEAFETLPGGQPGHVVASELEDETGAHDLTEELFEVEDESRLGMMLPSRVARGPGTAALQRRRRPTRRYIRIRVGGVPLRRRSPVSLRLDVSSAQPVLTVRIWVGERRAHEMATRLGRRDHVGVVGSFQAWVRGPLRSVLAVRLRRMLARRAITAPDAATAAAAGRLADAVALAFASQATSAASQLAAAAKDPQRGITLAFALSYPNRSALLTGAPARGAMAVTAGWRRD